MRLNKENRICGLIDGDYCLEVAHNMLELFNQAEVENDGFNSLEMLMIKALFDDIFQNNVKSRYKSGRDQVIDLLAFDDGLSTNNSMDENVINFFEMNNKE